MIKISNFRRVDVGCKKATCDVELPNIGLKICGMSMIESNGKSWADYPKGVRDEGLERKYFSHCEFIDLKRSGEFKKLVYDEMVKAEAIEPKELPIGEQSTEELPF